MRLKQLIWGCFYSYVYEAGDARQAVMASPAVSRCLPPASGPAGGGMKARRGGAIESRS